MSELTRAAFYVYNTFKREWVVWERSAQPPGHVWNWPNPAQRNFTALTWNVSCDPAFAVARAHSLMSRFVAIGPDIAGMQEVSGCSEDDAGAPGYRGRGFWDVLHENAFVRREYIITMIEEQNVRMFDGDAPYGSILLLRRTFISIIPQVVPWYCALESRDYSNLVGVDLCDISGQPWFSIATGQFEASPQEPDGHGAGADAEYAKLSRAAQFHYISRRGGALGRAMGFNALLLADLSIRSLEETQVFQQAGFTDVYRAANPAQNPNEGATIGGLSMQLVGFPPQNEERRRQDFIFAKGEWLTGATAELIGSTPLRPGSYGENLVDAMGRPLRVWPSTHKGVVSRMLVGQQEQDEGRQGPAPGKRARIH
ncbi:hypothetical protein DACRYDRAFT_98007 [Dacryopinax primogenitus]|uniref:Endonuclease/exonuclease/phosphatase domain-containing protein n=1 Tax=Dacryopinax primogenitus (strain DJM 731) TaxID=1858805 RepID=M5GD84_DACPD|nr:uncharacterized protein DACRYDRAFT_98007 [Dacryopinax primogenitus]EJU06655.1 hypothetical protein DACRYDRAFT_98007 [Dacryopinax primogenitus]